MTLLDVRALGVDFRGFRAVKAMSLQLRAGESLGLVGESGSGKTTLARAILKLIPASSGEVLCQGTDLLRCPAPALRRLRRDLQLISQHPQTSLDPRMTVAQALAEPLRVFEHGLSRRERGSCIRRMLDRVGLAESMLERYPAELSGGQCQRVAIARAMILEPRLLICDEPVSSLDASMQGQIVNLLVDLRRELGTALLFISHNLAVVRRISDRVMVIRAGEVIESSDCDSLFAAPSHPYTRELLAAVPAPLRELRLRSAASTAAP